jgi:hypothetical protein
MIETDDLAGLKMWSVTVEEMQTLRFELNMNFLQLVCHEESLEILKFMVLKFNGQDNAKRAMARHRDNHLGSQAIHLAATTGNR